MKSWPYCQHPECHNSRTIEYWDGGTNNLTTLFIGAFSLPLTRNGERPDVRRWCYTHALLNERAAFGSAA